MKYKKLIVVDLKENASINYDNALYVYLNNGKINFENSQRIYLKFIRKKNFFKIKSNLIKALRDKVNKSRKIVECFPELDFFNLRNDRDPSFDLLLNILLINKYKKLKKIKETIVVTDNEITKDYFSNNKSNKIVYINKKFNFKLKLYRLKVLKFYIKSFFVVFLAKLFNKNNKNNNDACITLFPIFFNKNREIFYEKNKSLKLNFLMADETQLNYSLYQIIRVLIKNKSKNLINVEGMISFVDLFESYKKANLYFKLTNKINFDLIVENYNFRNFYKNKINSSLINRSKLEIYNNAIKKIINLYNIKRINLYLFEYSFGFYLIKQFKKNSKNIKVHGYQHGIFYKDLLWLEIISNVNCSKDYYPDYIYAFNKKIINHYKNFFKQKKIKYISRPKKVSEISKKVKYNYKNNKNILILPGTHDAEEIVKILNDQKNNKNYDKFNYFIKFHPKKRINLNKESKLLDVEKIDNIYFDKVVISPTSTIAYDMIKLNKPFHIFDIDHKLKYVSTIPKF